MTIQAARIKGAPAIVTGISDAVAETIVDLGIDWNDIETVANLQAGLQAARPRWGDVSRDRLTTAWRGRHVGGQ